MEERLTELETVVMHQGLALDELNEVVTAHQKTIDHLLKELTQIKQQLVTASQNLLPSEEEPPPHY